MSTIGVGTGARFACEAAALALLLGLGASCGKGGSPVQGTQTAAPDAAEHLDSSPENAALTSTCGVEGPLRIVSLAPSAVFEAQSASYAIDGNLFTSWVCDGIGCSLRADLGAVARVSAVRIAWHRGNERVNSFTIGVSAAGSAMTEVFAGKSSGTTAQLETYSFAATSGRFVEIKFNGNTQNNFANLSELEIIGTAACPETPPTTAPSPSPSSSPSPSPTSSFPSDVRLSSTNTGPSLAGTRGIDKPMGSYVPALYTTLGVRASRGETVGFFVQSRMSACDTVDLAWHGTAPAEVGFKIYILPTITTTKGSYPGAYVGKHYDPVLVRNNQTICPATSGSIQSVWAFVELAIPTSTPAGIYSGSLRLRNTGVLMKLNLKVWPMVMPEKQALVSYAINWSPSNILGHYSSDPGVLATVTLQKKYLEMMRAHRISPIHGQVADPAIITVNGQLRLDLTTNEFKTLISGYRPSNAMIAMPKRKDLATGSSEFNRYWTAAENTVKAQGWAGRAFVYMYDEPVAADYPMVIARAKAIRQLAPSIKIMLTEEANSQLTPYFDIFVPVSTAYDRSGFPAPSVYETLKAQGKSIWWYISCMSHGCGSSTSTPYADMMVDNPSAHIRSIGWQSHRYGMQGFLYYLTNYKYHLGDPWQGVFAFGGNGDGTLFYPGRPGERGLTTHQPVASIRLKLWRETAFDAEYLKMIAARADKPAWFQTRLGAIVPSMSNFSKTYQDYQQLRNDIGDFIAGQ